MGGHSGRVHVGHRPWWEASHFVVSLVIVLVISDRVDPCVVRKSNCFWDLSGHSVDDGVSLHSFV